MSKQAFDRPDSHLGKRGRARLRSLRRQAQAWKTRIRRAAALSLAAASLWGGQAAFAQIGQVSQFGQAGQMGMAPAGGIVNRAVQGFQALDENGPGWLYYGINAADRGLGYNGSYFTLGGFIPYAEDDLGGLWSADLRSHLSTYGGFFSNVGVVRKQFMGGTIGGLGVYWDYDADANQYPTSGTVCNAPFGQFGHVYNQVGVSAEWLTDFGNLRSNGYIPVGTAAYTAGSPGSVFFQNYVMSNYGLDAALAGADLEVGAYVPGLADWAGMISVGGYTFGQARYNWTAGSKIGQDVVPYFGGVYTRLDLTLMRNWDFSLQANNDSFFDWTGFARLTYRMGGSRRRNVPDQMEQPMMRNEHIVRAHQTPEVACNPVTGLPWRVIHVNNGPPAGPAAAPAMAMGPMDTGPMAMATGPATATGPAAGTGTAESPFTTLAAADAAATRPWDIVLVSRGNGTSTGYDTEFSFNAPNQSLVGAGGPFYINSSCGGPINIGGPSGPLPLLSNPAGASVFIDGAIAGGARVANLQITGSGVGIEATGNLNGTPTAANPTGASTVSNVSITGSGSGALEQGVLIDNATGGINFTSTAISNMTNGGFVVSGGDPNVNYQGSITSDTASNGGVAGPIVVVEDTTGGTINLAVGAAPGSSTVANAITDIGGAGILVRNNTGGAINMGNVTLRNTVDTAISVYNSDATIDIAGSLVGPATGIPAGISKDTAGTAILIDGAGAGAPTFTYTGPLANAPATGVTSNMLTVANTTGGSVSLISPVGKPFTDSGTGILIDNNIGNVTVLGAEIASSGPQGILITNQPATPSGLGLFTFSDVTITGASAQGVNITNAAGSTAVFNNVDIDLTASGNTGIGFFGSNAGSIDMFGGSIKTNNTAISLAQAETVNMTPSLVSVGSGAAAGSAVLLSGAAPMGGIITLSPNFTVNGATGTATNVTNTSPVSLVLPP
jgi:hypothetical protein